MVNQDEGEENTEEGYRSEKEENPDALGKGAPSTQASAPANVAASTEVNEAGQPSELVS